MPISDAALAEILRVSRRIAVVGLGDKPHRPAYGVAAYLQRKGYRIVPVHPNAHTVLGEPVYRDLESAAAGAGPIDVVNVFRRSETIPDIVAGCVAAVKYQMWRIERVDTAPAPLRTPGGVVAGAARRS